MQLHALICCMLPLRPLHPMQLWLGGLGGNANFVYGMNLLWGGLQVILLLRLLRGAARAEARPSGGGQRAGAGAQQEQEQEGQVAADDGSPSADAMKED